MDVLRGRDRPEPVLLGELFEMLRAVDRALAPHLLEDLQWRPVRPVLPACQFDALDVAFDITLDACHLNLRDLRRRMDRDHTGWLASFVGAGRTRPSKVAVAMVFTP